MAEYQNNPYAPPQPYVSDASVASPKQQYQRSYQACLACRKRKVKCDLGSPEAPRDPPCAKCLREHKECRFSATRRKRRADNLDSESTEGEEETPIHLTRKKSARRQVSTEDGYAASASYRGQSRSIPPPSPIDSYEPLQTGHHGQFQRPERKPGTSQPDASQDQEVVSQDASLFKERLLAPNDSTSVLLDAVRHVEEADSSRGIKLEVQARTGDLPSKNAVKLQDGLRSTIKAVNPLKDPQLLDPALTGQSKALPEPSAATLRIWGRLRFVKAGWFKAREAANFVDYYYKHLAPLTPITHPDLCNLESNPELISQEPLLTVTILTIASRYMKVTGQSSDIRSLMIHDQLWHYLLGMVTRMFWGQEQFGGGFCGAGARSDTSDTTRLRTLGSIESLLLLSDFHPRSMHFPPGNDDGELLVPDGKPETPSPIENRAQFPVQSSLDGWVEPATRSDQMTWSLICFANTLAFELGVFGSYATGKPADGTTNVSEGVQSPYLLRMERVRRLLWIYMTQACGRFGFPSMYPIDYTKSFMGKMEAKFKNVTPASFKKAEAKDIAQHYWVEVISINKHCNDVLFQSRELTGQLIDSGQYEEILTYLVPVLKDWEVRLQEAPVDPLTKTLLSIEVNYFLVYVRGIALQAVLERYTNKVGSQNQAADTASPASSTSTHISQYYSQNEDHIRGVSDAARKVLSHVVEDLLPNDNLKHAPVRAVFRIVSAAMFLLKTFSLGAKRSEVDKSVNLLENTVAALRTSLVDDVHLSLRIAEVLEALTSRIKQRFIPFVPHIAPGPDTPSTPSRPSFPAIRPNGPLHSGRQNVPLIRKPRTGSFTNPIYIGDLNNTVMPPPRGMYPHPTANTWHNSNSSMNGGSYGQSAFSNMGSPTSPQTSHFYDNIGGIPTNVPYSSGDDWLTLPLDNLMDSDGLIPGGDPMSFGSIFGLETRDGLGDMDRLADEPFSGNEQAQFGPM